MEIVELLAVLHRVTPGASQGVGWRSVLFWRKRLAASSAGPKGWIPAAARARHSSFAEAALTALLTVPAKPRRLDRNIPRNTRMCGSECASRPPEPPTGSAAAPHRSESGQGSLWTPSHPHCPQGPQDPPPSPSVPCSPGKEEDPLPRAVGFHRGRVARSV